MPEVLNLSLSPQANHIITHFYNTQESYIDYTRSVTKSANDPSVYFKPTLSYDKSSINYTPRALIWDFKGGFGALGQFEYADQTGYENGHNQDEWYGNIEKIVRPRIPKNQYQKALDQSENLPELGKEDTKYWTDYSRLIYEPRSYNELSNWEYDPVEYPEGRLVLGQEQKFTGYEVGVSEWDSDSRGLDFLEDKYRVMLENCDNLSGINLVSEIDSAWGGFSSELLRELRDGYNPKSVVFTWGLFNGKQLSSLTNIEILNRIRTFLELQRNSSIFIPLGTPNDIPEELEIDQTSLWQTSALKSLVFEPFQTVNSQREHRTNFNALEDNLTLGSQRKIVSLVEAVVGGADETSLRFAENFFPQTDRKETHVYSRSTVFRPPQTGSESDITQLSEAFGNSSKLENAPQSDNAAASIDRSVTKYKSSIPLSSSPALPKLIKSSNSLKTTLGVTTKPKKTLQEMKVFVSKFVRGDDRENMIQELEVLAEEYTFGWDYSDESDDDF